MKFTSDLPGSITGIRFYKSARQHRHPHRQPVDRRRDAAGAATFTGETASGWQQVNFADRRCRSPPEPTYVASYFAPGRPLLGDGDYFAASGVDNPPLHALADGVSGGNGVYAYGSASGFPTITFNSENYWVDVRVLHRAGDRAHGADQVTATAGQRVGASVLDRAPDGGSPITSYTVTPYIGTTAQTPTTVTGSPPATTPRSPG